MNFIKRLLGIHKKFPNYSKTEQDIAIQKAVKSMIEDNNKLFKKNTELGAYEAIGPAHTKHIRNHILTKIDPTNETTYQLTNSSGYIYPGYQGTEPICDNITEELLPYVTYMILSVDKASDTYDNFGQLVSRVILNGLNKNPLGNTNIIIKNLPENEKQIHLLSFISVCKFLKFNYTEDFTKKILKNPNALKLPRYFNKHVLLSLYVQAKVTNNQEDISRFTKMFHLDRDNNLFPAVLAYDLGIISKKDIRNFVTHHVNQGKFKGIFNYLAPLLILEQITPLKGL